MNGQSWKGFVLTLISQIISLIFGHRLTLTFHAGTNQTYFPRESCRFCVLLFSLIFGLSRKIICNDDAVKRRICEYGINARKIISIPAFSVQYLDFVEQTLSIELEAFFKEHSPVLSSYSLLRPTFHIDTTICALAQLRERWRKIGLIFIGSIKKAEDMDPQFVFQLIQQLGLEDQIYWTGDLDHDTFLTVIKRSKVFVRTYVFDGVCSSVLEALSLGIPVIACENDLRPKDAVIFKTGDAADLAAKIKYVLENYHEVVQNLSRPKVRNTLMEEVNVLIGR